MSAEARPRLLWRLRVLMAERDIRTVRELRRRLASLGVTLSEPQLGRIVKELPGQINTVHLSALCAVLDASPGDLLQIAGRTNSYPSSLKPSDPGAPAAAGFATPAPTVIAASTTFDPKVGPKLSSFHKPDVT